MRSYIFLICAAVLLISCNKKIVVDVVPDEKEIVAVQERINTVTSRETVVETAENVIRLPGANIHVNVPEGLRVRSSPGLDGNIINKLADKEPVEVIEFSKEMVEIDGINGRWAFVRSGEIEGWVFDGYLDGYGVFTIDNMYNEYIKEYRRAQSGSIVIEYKKYENEKYILVFDIFHGRADKTLFYFFQVFIKKSEYNSIVGHFEKYGDPGIDFASRYFSEPISEFTYDIFLNELREYLIEHEEKEKDINTILSMLSNEEEAFMSKITE